VLRRGGGSQARYLLLLALRIIFVMLLLTSTSLYLYICCSLLLHLSLFLSLSLSFSLFLYLSLSPVLVVAGVCVCCEGVCLLDALLSALYTPPSLTLGAYASHIRCLRPFFACIVIVCAYARVSLCARACVCVEAGWATASMLACVRMAL